MATYRQQTGATLGTSQTCATATVFVASGATFATAVNLYSDAALTTLATAGYYSANASCSTP